jgi:DNA invertase Pin-like site-specific DNA recombinase
LCSARGWEMIAPPFTEIESGKRADRPELLKALERAKLTGAILVVAKLDRLSRNVAFLATLQDSGVAFVAADMPEANELTVHIMAAVAQHERKAISKRTTEALSIKRQELAAVGKRLGNPNGAASLRRAGKGSQAAVAALKARADTHAGRLRPVIARLRAEGITTLPKLADALNAQGILTPRNARWHPSSVQNLLARLDG